MNENTTIGLGGNWILFDTCTISKFSEIGDVSDIINDIQDRVGPFTPVITKLVRLEYLRKANNSQELEEFKSYLETNYSEIKLNNPDDRFDILDMASELACICRYADRSHAVHADAVTI